MYSSETAEFIGVLLKRRDFLEALFENPQSKRSLEDSLDTSRSTVNRAVRELAAVDLIEQTSTNSYCVTEFGQLIYNQWKSTETIVDSLRTSDALKSSLPTGEHGEAVAFCNAEITVPSHHDTDRPQRRFLECLQQADRFKGILPKITSCHVELLSHRSSVGPYETELVTVPGVIDVLSTTYNQRFGKICRADTFDLYVSNEHFPFGLMLFDSQERCQLGLILYDMSGISGFVANSDTTAIGWGNQWYERHRKRAKRITS